MNWNRTSIEKAIVTELAHALGIPENGIHPDSKLIADLGAESIDLIDLAFRLESRFDIRLPEGISLDTARSERRDPTVADLVGDIAERLDSPLE